jgi:hypothetical protein
VPTKYLVPTIAVASVAVAGLALLNPPAALGRLVLISPVLALLTVGWLVVLARRRRWGQAARLLGALGAGSAAIFLLMRDVRHHSQDKAIASYQIRAAFQNARDQQPERVFFTYEDLIGPRAYIKGTVPVAGEDYHELFPLRADSDVLSITMGDGRKNIVVFGASAVRAIALEKTMDRNRAEQIRMNTERERFWVGQSVSGKLTGEVAAYQAWLAAQDRTDGLHVTTAPQGGRFETTWHGGMPHGPFRAYYRSGELWAEATYERGRPAGRHVLYDRLGKLIHETAFVPWRRVSTLP